LVIARSKSIFAAHGGGTSQPQKRSGFEYARTTDKRMIAHSSQPEQSWNILQFRRDLKFAPKCAQCGLRMAIMRAEPDLKARVLRITYRCLECGLLDRFPYSNTEIEAKSRFVR
jgi:predicted RNA-binding Zn-ribbon protein involved in translation (DUF1610 family)